MAEPNIIERIEGLRSRFKEVSMLITDPEVIADRRRFERLSKEYKDLERILAKGDEYSMALQTIEDAKELQRSESDPDMLSMIKEEMNKAQESLPTLEEEIKLLLVPADPEDAKNAIIEIRAGTGGDEAALFAADLYKMYTKFCESMGWRVEISSLSEGSLGGFKEIVFTVSGEDVYGVLKYESGVHRVQRVPATETQGRVHTSAATVAVLPEADEFDVEVKESDIRVDTFCSSGAGGQSVNTTYSAVRLVHIPTGIVVQSQDERSQLKNKARAMTELRSRIYNLEHQKYLDSIASKRKTMVSTGDRSAKIRTYNFPQGCITDHRIGRTVYNLSSFLDGDIKEMIDALIVAENMERLKEAEL